MSFLRRLFGSGDDRAPSAADEPPGTPAEVEAAERAYEADLLRAEQGRLDELRQRQLRYADHVWQPPAQGGERRADDDEAERDG